MNKDFWNNLGTQAFGGLGAFRAAIKQLESDPEFCWKIDRKQAIEESICRFHGEHTRVLRTLENCDYPTASVGWFRRLEQDFRIMVQCCELAVFALAKNSDGAIVNGEDLVRFEIYCGVREQLLRVIIPKLYELHAGKADDEEVQLITTAT